jgi:hypothetical protein
MIARRKYILIVVLAASAACIADAPGPDALTPQQYRLELDRLLAATSRLDSSGERTPAELDAIPDAWHVREGQRTFDISAEGLHRDLRRYETGKSAETALAIRRRLEMLERDIDGFEKPAPDPAASRAKLNAILANREFRSVAGPGWPDRLKRRLLELVVDLLQKMFRAIHISAIPNISRYFVYGLIGAALLALIYIAYRVIWRGQETTEVLPRDLPVSAKERAIWLAEAKAAAARTDWRDAIHLAYWAGISFLERQGFWKPDRARTPREYLRIFTGSGEHRETLTSLTKIFELAWYAKRDASEASFAQALAELEKLGCQ